MHLVEFLCSAARTLAKFVSREYNNVLSVRGMSARTFAITDNRYSDYSIKLPLGK